MSAEPWDLLAPADLDDLYDAEARVTTEMFLLGRRGWPYGTVLTVKRPADGSIELGYVRRVLTAGLAEPVVYTDDGPVTQRRYADLTQLIAAGWRVD
jgi:hypothetical protein